MKILILSKNGRSKPVEKLLEERGSVLLHVKNIDQGLEIFKEREPDVVLIDPDLFKDIMRRIDKERIIKVKDIEIDLNEHTVMKNGKSIELTYTQFKILYLLASDKNTVFPREQLLKQVWPKTRADVTNRTVDVHIKRLREKLGEKKYPSQYIETIWKGGYRFIS